MVAVFSVGKHTEHRHHLSSVREHRQGSSWPRLRIQTRGLSRREPLALSANCTDLRARHRVCGSPSRESHRPSASRGAVSARRREDSARRWRPGRVRGPVDGPPCILQRPLRGRRCHLFHTTGARQGLPSRVRAPQRGRSRLLTPPPSHPLRSRRRTRTRSRAASTRSESGKGARATLGPLGELEQGEDDVVCHGHLRSLPYRQPEALDRLRQCRDFLADSGEEDPRGGRSDL